MRDQATIQEILDGNYYSDIPMRFHVYAVLDHKSDAVLYVGSSFRNAPRRIKEHMQQSTGIGRFILRNQPTSLSWIVEFYDHRDLLETETVSRLPLEWQIREAETNLIRKLNPCFNIADNPEFVAVPTEYGP